MRPFLGIDLTNDRKNEKMNGDGFIVAAAPTAQRKTIDKLGEDQFDLIMNKTKLPLPVRIIGNLCGLAALLAALLFGAAYFKEDSEITPEMLFEIPWLIPAAAICLAVWIGCTVWGHIRSKKIMNGDENAALSSEIDSLADDVSAELGVPSNAAEADIITVTYKTKNGKLMPRTQGMMLSPYINYVMRIFSDGENLYLADWENKYAVPMGELRRIRTVKKSVTLPIWYKDTEPNKGEYKKYKITEGNTGTVTIKSYHILEFEHGGETWGVYFPCYELDVFERMTGIKAESE